MAPRLWTFVTVLVCALLVPACGRETPSAEAVEGPTPAIPAGPADPRSFRYTRAIALDERPGYSLITIDPGALGRWRFRYALVPRGTRARISETDAVVVEVPVQRVTVEISGGIQQYIDDLGASDAVVGISNVAGVYPWLTRLHQRLVDGLLVQIDGGSATNLERVLELKPELALSDFTGGDGSLWRLRRTKVASLAFAVRLERHPLASAEWIKLLGLLFNREAEAAVQFARIEARYRELVDRVAGVEERPRVLPMRMAAETWSDRDVIRQMVVDAGGQPVPTTPDAWRYFYEYPYEVILDQGADAHVWPFGRFWWKTPADITAEDARLSAFRSVREGRVYHPHGRMQSRLVDPYFSALYLYPDLVLADLIRIFHPDVLPDHQLHYFRAIDGGAQ